MLRLGTRVRMAGQDAQVVARTLAGKPAYDIRLADGRLVKYAALEDFEVVDEAGTPSVVPRSSTVGDRRGG